MENAILLADKNSNAWEFAKKIQDYLRKEKDIEVPLKEVSIKFFRNNEMDIHVPENVRKKDIYFIQDSTKNPQVWWVELMLLKDLLLSASAESLTFVLPNMLYSRKDRKEKPHVPISARALARTISQGIKRVITMDLHAPQIQGFYPESIPLDNLYSFPEVVRYFFKENGSFDPENLVVVSPDVGGVERAGSLAKRINPKNPVTFIEKRRKTAGEVEGMRLVGDVYGKDVLLVDDIIDSGGTLCKAADLLKEKGAKRLICYGTHGIFTMGYEKLFEKFDRVITNNTHNKESNKNLEVIDVSSIFAEAIYRAQKGLSISKLFEL